MVKAAMTFACAMAAGLVGAVAWVLVVYFLNMELGLIAWGIGVVAGFGARFAAKEWVGFAPGAIATAAAVSCVAIGKLSVVAVALQAAGPAPVKSDEAATEWVAFGIAMERGAMGIPMAWPHQVDPDRELVKDDFPQDVWQEAEQRWAGFTDRQKSRYRAHPVMLNRAWVKGMIAGEVAQEWARDGKTIYWTDGTGGPPDDEMELSAYPTDVLLETEIRYSKLNDAAREGYEDRVSARVGSSASSAFWPAFASTFAMWDVLWIGLAAWSAFRIGKGGTPGSGYTPKAIPAG